MVSFRPGWARPATERAAADRSEMNSSEVVRERTAGVHHAPSDPSRVPDVRKRELARWATPISVHGIGISWFGRILPFFGPVVLVRGRAVLFPDCGGLPPGSRAWDCSSRKGGGHDSPPGRDSLYAAVAVVERRGSHNWPSPPS